MAQKKSSEKKMPSRLERRMLRINLDENIVRKAKKWAAKIRQEEESRITTKMKDQKGKMEKPKPPNFRETINIANATYSKFIDCCLAVAGFIEHTKSEKERIWPISIQTADDLKEMASKRGIDRTLWIRALLKLAANDVKVPKGETEEEIRIIVDNIVRAVLLDL